jgi:hypothetical protein
MGNKNAVVAALRWSRRRLGTVRSLSPAVIALMLALVIGGAGLADAATGGTFILGKANAESSTASLSDSAGTPLALSAPSGKAPLSVNRNVMVKNLNAQYVGGLSAASLQATGGDGITPPGAGIGLTSGTVVAKTGPLQAGTYYVTATALLSVYPGNTGAFCYITKASNPNSGLSTGGGDQTGYMQADETAAVSVAAGDALQEWCYIFGNASGSFAYNAGIIAIRVLSSSGTPPVSAVRPGSATQPGK